MIDEWSGLAELLANLIEKYVSDFDNLPDIEIKCNREKEKGKTEDTRQHLAGIIPLVRDKHTKDILFSTEKKLGYLSDSNCEKLISYVKRRKGIENNRFIRKKLDKLKAESKDKDGVNHKT